MCDNQESTDATTGVPHRHSMRLDAGCGGRHRYPRVSAASDFYFFIYFLFLDTHQFAPICADLGRIRSYRLAETCRYRSIPALNQAEIQVKIILKKECQKKKKNPKTITSSLALYSLLSALCLPPCILISMF